MVRGVVREVKPLLSVDRDEARRRVLSLYKAWYRQIPYIEMEYKIPRSKDQMKAKLREMFDKNKHITDIRVIDMLALKGQMELVEVVKHWKQSCHIMDYWKETHELESKPKDFLSKFYSGQT